MKILNEDIIKVTFICPECKQQKTELRFGCIDKKKNKEAERKIWTEGFICIPCFKKLGIWRAEELLNKRL